MQGVKTRKVKDLPRIDRSSCIIHQICQYWIRVLRGFKSHAGIVVASIHGNCGWERRERGLDRKNAMLLMFSLSPGTAKC